MVSMYADGQLQSFHGAHYRAGHRATDYERWLATDRPYRVRYEEVGDSKRSAAS